MTLFRTEAGHMILGIGGVLLFMGWFVMNRMVNFEI
jgi:Flp pilus assembly protein TadB